MNINENELRELIEQALEARKNAYTPYSHFKVGAALKAASGKVYTGCNIENASYSLSNCAERTAIFKAVSEKEKEFEMIIIVGGEEGKDNLDYCPPCGSCRQVISEFCDKDFKIVLAKNPDEYIIKTLDELLPYNFSL